MTKNNQTTLAILAEQAFEKELKLSFKNFNRGEFPSILDSEDLHIVEGLSKNDWEAFEAFVVEPTTAQYTEKYGNLDSLKGSETYFDYANDLESAKDHYSNLVVSILGKEKSKWKANLKKYKTWLAAFRIFRKIERSIQEMVYSGFWSVNFINISTRLSASFQEIKPLLVSGDYKFGFDDAVKEFIVTPIESSGFAEKTFVAYLNDGFKAENKEIVNSKIDNEKEVLRLTYKNKVFCLNGRQICKKSKGSAYDNLLEFLIENPNRTWKREELKTKNILVTNRTYNPQDAGKSIPIDTNFYTFVTDIKVKGEKSYYRIGEAFFYELGKDTIHLKNPIYQKDLEELGLAEYKNIDDLVNKMFEEKPQLPKK